MDQNEEMKRLRHEIYKFAMSGLEANKRTKAKESLAISLGAKVSFSNQFQLIITN